MECFACSASCTNIYCTGFSSILNIFLALKFNTSSKWSRVMPTDTKSKFRVLYSTRIVFFKTVLIYSVRGTNHLHWLHKLPPNFFLAVLKTFISLECTKKNCRIILGVNFSIKNHPLITNKFDNYCNMFWGGEILWDLSGAVFLHYFMFG